MQMLSAADAPTHDLVIMSHNYAGLLAETGEPVRAVTALQKCSELVKATNSEMSADYADLIFDIAAITIQTSGVPAAEQYFIRAFRIYRTVLTDGKKPRLPLSILSVWK